MNFLYKASEAICSFVEGAISFFTSPVISSIDWMAKKWLKYEISEKDAYANFLEDALAAQREALSQYIRENRTILERLEKFEKNGEHTTLKHFDWLNSEVARLSNLIKEVQERNENLSHSNSKLVSAGNELAEIVANNKPKKKLNKKDKEIISAISRWNESVKI